MISSHIQNIAVSITKSERADSNRQHMIPCYQKIAVNITKHDAFNIFIALPFELLSVMRYIKHRTWFTSTSETTFCQHYHLQGFESWQFCIFATSMHYRFTSESGKDTGIRFLILGSIPFLLALYVTNERHIIPVGLRWLFKVRFVFTTKSTRHSFVLYPQIVVG